VAIMYSISLTQLCLYALLFIYILVHLATEEVVEENQRVESQKEVSELIQKGIPIYPHDIDFVMKSTSIDEEKQSSTHEILEIDEPLEKYGFNAQYESVNPEPWQSNKRYLRDISPDDDCETDPLFPGVCTSKSI